MELALNVIGRMASRQQALNSLGLKAGFFVGGAGSSGRPLVHDDLDRCAVAEVARSSRDRKRVSSSSGAWRRYGE
jgi:hypothetical protein